MIYSFTSVKEFIHGKGSIEKLGASARAIADNVLLVTGKSHLKRSGILETVMNSFKQSNIDVTLYSEVVTEPTVHMVDAGIALINDNNISAVVGIGGGSVLDAAKAMAGLAGSGISAADAQAGAKYEVKNIPFIAVPTTSGTGSEATMVSVLTNPEKKLKKSIRHPKFHAAVTILDPLLTIPCPPAITAASGMDAFTQAVESYLSTHSDPMTEPVSLEAIRLISRSIVKAYENGNDIEARTDMAYGSLMAGIALNNARLGAVHGIAHPLGALFHIPHGRLCGILLPYTMKKNYNVARSKYMVIEDILGGNAIEFVERTNERLAIPKTLREYALDESLYPQIIEESLESGSLKADPKKYTARDVEEILNQLRT